MRHWRTFRRALGLNIGMTFRYRGEFLLMQIGNLIVPITSLLVWQAALASGANLPVDGEYLHAYFLLISVAVMLTSSWTAFYLSASIRDGSLNRWLIRPTSTHLDAVANNVGEKAVKIILIVPMILIISLFWRDQVSLPGSPERWLLAVVALVLAAAIRFTLDVLIGSLAFWYEDVQGFIRASAVIVPIFSGAVVPLALMPTWLAEAMALQPFRFMLSFPMEVLLGDGSGALAGFGLQALWLLIFLVGAGAVWRLGLRSYSAAGV